MANVKINRNMRISITISLALIVLARVVQLTVATTNPTILTTTSEIAKQQHQTQDDFASKKTTTTTTSGASARSGRMLNLDVMAGEMGKDEKAAQERLQSGNRQSRILTEDIKLTSEATKTGAVEGRSPSSGKKGGKKMSIKGFIPIVSLDGKHTLDGLESDSDSDSDSETEGGDQQLQQNNLRQHLQNSYGGQTSMGHASFAPPPQQQQQPQQPQSNDQWQQMNTSPTSDQDQEAGRANRKLFGSSNILSGLTGGPGKRGLVSSLVPSALSQAHLGSFGTSTNYNQQPQNFMQQQPTTSMMLANQLSGPMNMPPVQAASNLFSSSIDPTGECICVPFFQCKNGYLSESQLSKSQLAQINQMTAGNSMHQIPRSLSGFKTQSSTIQQANDLNYYPTSQQQHQADQQVAQQQANQMSQQPDQQQQQLVNDMIYEQLRKSIEGANLEQQLQQQEAYNQANQQHLSLIDERSQHAKSTNTTSQTGELEERSLLKPLATRRQFQSASQKCGIMRTCCRIPPRSVRAAPSQFMSQTQSRPLSMFQSPAAARFIQQPQHQMHSLIASASIQRPQNHYQLLQPVRQQQQQQQQHQLTSLVAPPQSVMQDFNYQQQQQQSQSQQLSALDAYPMTALQSTAVANMQQQAPKSQGSFMQGRCGIRQTLGISGRVANADAQQPGAESSAEFGEFPAHAAILKRLSPGDSLFVCSAVLISSQWLSTAAHCVRKSRPEELKVRLGEWDVNRDDEFYPYFESNVREIVIHPDFQASSLINDIALLRLEQPIDQQQMPHIAPACLANEQPGSDFSGQRCWVAGWGKDAFGQQGTFQSVLKKVDLPVVSHHECELALKYQTKLGKHFRLHASNICAGGERGKDACEGDGGAGLYCLDPVSGLSKAVGLVSWGVGCGQRGVPGVYVNLAHFSPWIEQVVATSGEENVYLDARINGSGVDAQAFKNIISERSNFNATAPAAAAAAAAGSETSLTTQMPVQNQVENKTLGAMIDNDNNQSVEARQAQPNATNGTTTAATN